MEKFGRSVAGWLSRARTREIRWAAWLAAALMLSGCVGWAGEYDPSRTNAISGRAMVEIGGYRFPLDGASIVVSGVHSGSTSTSRNGSYSYTRMAPGRHKVTLRALHGTYEDSVYIQQGEGQRYTLDWRVRPSRLDAETFFYLSGLTSLYVDDRGRFQTEPGTLVRWEKPVVRVYFDEAGAPIGLPRDTVDRYVAELRRWEGYLKNTVRFVRARDAHSADIVVYWVPKGYLGDHAGIARHAAYYANGALKRVEIEIDVAYATFPGLWEHEFAHAMGADHVADRASVLYPYLLAGQRTTLSSHELAHVRLLYDVPSGQELGKGYGALLGTGDDASESGLDGGLDQESLSSHETLSPPEFLSPDESLLSHEFSSRHDSGSSHESPPSFVFDAVPVQTAAGSREHTLYVDESLLEAWRAEQGASEQGLPEQGLP